MKIDFVEIDVEKMPLDWGVWYCEIRRQFNAKHGRHGHEWQERFNVAGNQFLEIYKIHRYGRATHATTRDWRKQTSLSDLKETGITK